MQELRFDGRTAIVTGAGGNPSLGRTHALLLASRGASVVVNDIGLDPEARHYPGAASAETVVQEIIAAGGKAIACTDSVASLEGAEAIVRTALDAFGGVDILVNNAGITIGAPFADITPRDIQRHIDVNLMGTIWCSRAAWPHMAAAKYGRIVNITSASMTGFADQAVYAASKGGVWSLTRALAAEGDRLGIKVNAVSPGAYTRMVISSMEEDSPILAQSKSSLPPELSSPAVGYLAHEACPVTGECLDAVGGQVQRCFISRTEGFTDRDHAIETIADRWDEVMDETQATTVGLALMDTSQWGLRAYRPGNQKIS
ncbi:SDR family NAD(P)-dependent oxidoreductase [Novosphingobium sp. G106]|uniref:SDR family NAD(P)-dependent oxidoreductase n=1 Tax=Novosphingobium sp. G106 TaxID=2849500 RepID=UPI001C2CE394|nr:SDR family NAD(P)-dependent oxidoreductase [Novosphingobium sp. G106]MBV1687167.1 SDR family NAD(P)-dependent oxidoreductase [Novosphingobium sp. G106]